MSEELKIFRLISEGADLETIRTNIAPCTHSSSQGTKCMEMSCVNAWDIYGNTAMHLAAQAETNSYEIIKILFEQGKANPGIKNFAGETPVLIAAKKGNLESLKYLISKCSEQGFSYGILNRLSNDTLKKTCRQNQGNVIEKACESKNEDCVNYLIDEIFEARRTSMNPTLNSQISTTSSVESLNVKEFLSVSDTKQIVFFELGNDLAKSIGDHDNSTYAKILFNTPLSFRHLLDGCIFTFKNKIYVDFFPFYNPCGGSELSILKIMIHYQRFELLTHPVCELFLHLNWLRARLIYGLVILFYFLFTFTTLLYTLLSYGQLSSYFGTCSNMTEERDATAINQTIETNHDTGGMPCIAKWLRIPLIILTTFISIIEIAKLFADRGGLSVVYNKFYWVQLEMWSHIIITIIVILEQLPESIRLPLDVRKVLSTILVLIVSRTMVRVISRDPDIAIFVEMVKKIQSGLCKILISYIWLYVGWIIVFHITLGDNAFSSFHDIGSASAKVMAMFTGEIGFEAAFKASTSFQKDFIFHSWIAVIYTVFIFEMCLTLMNVIIGLAISNIQDLRQKGDAFRLAKEVLLGGYLESLLRSNPFRNDFKLVDAELFHGRSIYCLNQLVTDESVVPSYTLELLEYSSRFEVDSNNQKKLSNPIPVPMNIGIKLWQLFKDMNKKTCTKDKKVAENILSSVTELSEEIKNISFTLKILQKEFANFKEDCSRSSKS